MTQENFARKKAEAYSSQDVLDFVGNLDQSEIIRDSERLNRLLFNTLESQRCKDQVTKTHRITTQTVMENGRTTTEVVYTDNDG